jgi:hypothetical protein
MTTPGLAAASVGVAMATQTASRPARTRRPKPAAQLTGEQLAEVVPLIQASDSVELKLTVPEPHQRSTIMALGLDPLQAQIRQVVFFDTPDLDLDKAGVVVRARRVQGKGEDSVVKLRPVIPEAMPGRLRKSASFRVEVDALPGGFVCSGTLKGASRPGELMSVLKGERAIRKLFSKEQREFYAANAPDGIALDDLSVLGPIFVLKLRFFPQELNRKMVAESWLYPDGSRILELSTRCLTGEAFQAAAETRAYLATKGVEISGDQQTKTRKALAYFAKHAG